MAYIVRELTTDDYNQYFDLINDFRTTSFSKDDYILILNEIKKSSTIIVIEENNKIVATTTIIYEHKFIYNITKLAHIEDVCVKKEFRNKGYGKIIMKHAIEHAKQNDAYKITLVCNQENIDFYKKCGFEERGRQMSILLS
jgi:glucosamine-phosphate N-acetyltransferase